MKETRISVPAAITLMRWARMLGVYLISLMTTLITLSSRTSRSWSTEKTWVTWGQPMEGRKGPLKKLSTAVLPPDLVNLLQMKTRSGWTTKKKAVSPGTVPSLSTSTSREASLMLAKPSSTSALKPLSYLMPPTTITWVLVNKRTSPLWVTVTAWTPPKPSTLKKTRPPTTTKSPQVVLAISWD